MVRRVFDALDSLGGRKGFLTVDDFKAVYSTSQHPAVVSGQLSRAAALAQFVASFESADGRITYDDWVRHYEEVSCLISSDDLFTASMATAWKHVKKKSGPTAPPTPVVEFVSSQQIDALEAAIKKSIYQKQPTPEYDPRRKMAQTFRSMDTDGSGGVSLEEFIGALERFGLHVEGKGVQGCGGIKLSVVQALFSKYDEDGSGFISYREFSKRFFEADLKREALPRPMGATRSFYPAVPTYFEPERQTAKPIYPGNAWLKGSNHIFD